MSDTIKPQQKSMPKLDFEPHMPVMVDLNPLSAGSSLVQAEFVGMAHYEYLIIRLPGIPGLVKKIVPQMRLLLQFQSAAGSINKSVVELISFITRPGIICFTSYPDRLVVQETRRHQRITCALPASIATAQGKAMAVLMDLSRGGGRLALELTGQSAQRNLNQGDAVALQVPFSAESESTKGTGIVRSADTSGSVMHLGLSFDDNKEFTSALEKYMGLAQVLG
jgi:hypothetical protein